VPGSFGFDEQLPTEMSEYSPARAKALLDTYGYTDRNGDDWREPGWLTARARNGNVPSQLDRRQNEHWKRSMDAVACG
jgi:ABC-type transport system substrate-binding protein